MKNDVNWTLVTRLAILAAVLVATSLTSALTPIRNIQSRFQIQLPARITLDPMKNQNKNFEAIAIPKDHQLWRLSQLNSAATFPSGKTRLPERHTEFVATSVWSTKLKSEIWNGILLDVFKPLPKTASELSKQIQSEPNIALVDQHPKVGAIGKAFDATSNQRALQSLAQGIKAGVEFDTPPMNFTIGHYRDKLEAADTLRELTSAAAERALAWRPSADAKLRSPFVDLEPENVARWNLRAKDSLERQLDLEVLQGYLEKRLQGAFERLGAPKTSDNGIWGKFIKDAHSEVAVVRFGVDADGTADIKLNTPEFQNITGKVPLRAIARELAINGDSPEITMLLPR